MLKKMVFFFHLLFLLSFFVSGERQDSIVSVKSGDLSEVASSILKAETWLKTHVLAHYPSIPITAIVVGGGGGPLLCRKEQENTLALVLPALKNLHHSLTRWGLQEHIKLSATFAPSCFDRSSYSFGKFVRPVLYFIKGASPTVSPTVSPTLVSSHSESLEDFIGVSFNSDDVPVILDNPGERKPSGRKLYADPFPARPTPLPEISETPLHSSVGFSVPANVAKNPHPPQPQTASPPLQVPSPQPRTAFPSPPLMLSPEAQTASPPPPQIASPPDMSFSSAPENPPFVDESPPPPPSPATFPPCRNPIPTHVPPPAPAPQMAVHKLWCVAKPTVPSDTLQVAMDYACGDGDADCKEIMPDGNCYNPDSVVAHASYAFNSYWQKNKRTGGTCNFDGTAMLINNDPSYLQCRFVLT